MNKKIKFSIHILIIGRLRDFLTWKDYIFASICWLVKSFFRLSTKSKQKYNIYHVNNFIFNTPNTKYCLIKNMPNYNRFHVNCYLKATCNILLKDEWNPFSFNKKLFIYNDLLFRVQPITLFLFERIEGKLKNKERNPLSTHAQEILYLYKCNGDVRN